MAEQHAETVIESGWLSSARRLPSPNCDARPPGMPIDLIVIHAISLPPGEFGGPFIADLFLNRLDHGAHAAFAELVGLRVSAHFLLDRRGSLTQFVSLARRAWHAGVSAWGGREACNDFSIGIELEGCDEVPFSDAQYVALGALIATLRAHLPALADSRVVGHSDIAPTRKTDPGPHFDWARLRRSLVA